MYQVVGYHRPASLVEALQLLAAEGRVALAGGVHLHHDGGADATELVDLQALGLDAVDISETSARLGAMVRLQSVADEPRLPDVIRRAARAEQPSTLRSLATLGGLIVTGADDSLLLAALLAHDAVVRLASGTGGERSSPLAGLLADRPRPGDLIVDVAITTTGRSALARTGRTPGDTPIVGVVGRRVGDITTFGLCGVSERPLRLAADEFGSLDPIGDHRATSAYRAHLVEILAGRVMEELS